jgi:hypothetical protein
MRTLFAEAREAHTLAESRVHELLRATLQLVKDEGRQTMKYFVLAYNRGPGELSGVEEFSDGSAALNRRMKNPSR